MRKPVFRFLLVIIVLGVLGVAAYNLPPVHARVAWRVDELRSRIQYALHPPEKAVFVPQDPVAAVVEATLQALTPSATPTPSATATPGPAGTAGPTPTATPTPVPLPESVSLPGVVYVDQHNRWNYCGPANLAMALNFWGWKGNRDDIAKVVKPGPNDPNLSFIDRGKTDKNVMPYELTGFVQDDTEYHTILRYGGDLELLKHLIAAGFPVVTEKGYYERDYTGKISWMGHYLFVTGYDDAQQGFIVQDAYLVPGKDLLSKYDVFEEGWRSFNYLFFVVYPPEREQEVLDILGNWVDVNWANQHALDVADAEVKQLSGIDLFFAWFNKGTSHVQLFQYNDAAAAYDQAFAIYATLGSDDKQRPYRILWYQTGPYWAYFYTGRYQDVIDLANTTFQTIDKPTLEESLYWRGMAEQALGDGNAALADFKEAVRLNPNFSAGIAKLQEFGIFP